MLKRVTVETEIEASPDRVWQVLTEYLPQHPSPFGIVRLDGELKAGGRIALWSDVAPERAFKLKVARFEPPKCMVWRGGMPLGLFVGTRTFSLRASRVGTQFQLEEVFSGPLSGLITRSMPDLQPSFNTFANTLKEEAEKQ